MGLRESQHEYYRNVGMYMASKCPPNEPLLGVMVTSHSSAFSSQIYGVGVTPTYLMMQKINKKQEPDGEPVYLQRGDIIRCALWGHGGGMREFLAPDSEYELRFQTATMKYKLAAWGGWTMAKLMGDEYMQGMNAVANWLASCQHRS